MASLDDFFAKKDKSRKKMRAQMITSDVLLPNNDDCLRMGGGGYMGNDSICAPASKVFEEDDDEWRSSEAPELDVKTLKIKDIDETGPNGVDAEEEDDNVVVEVKPPEVTAWAAKLVASKPKTEDLDELDNAVVDSTDGMVSSRDISQTSPPDTSESSTKTWVPKSVRLTKPVTVTTTVESSDFLSAPMDPSETRTWQPKFMASGVAPVVLRETGAVGVWQSVSGGQKEAPKRDVPLNLEDEEQFPTLGTDAPPKPTGPKRGSSKAAATSAGAPDETEGKGVWRPKFLGGSGSGDTMTTSRQSLQGEEQLQLGNKFSALEKTDEDAQGAAPLPRSGADVVRESSVAGSSATSAAAGPKLFVPKALRQARVLP